MHPDFTKPHQLNLIRQRDLLITLGSPRLREEYPIITIEKVYNLDFLKG